MFSYKKNWLSSLVSSPQQTYLWELFSSLSTERANGGSDSQPLHLRLSCFSRHDKYLSHLVHRPCLPRATSSVLTPVGTVCLCFWSQRRRRASERPG